MAHPPGWHRVSTTAADKAAPRLRGSFPQIHYGAKSIQASNTQCRRVGADRLRNLGLLSSGLEQPRESLYTRRAELLEVLPIRASPTRTASRRPRSGYRDTLRYAGAPDHRTLPSARAAARGWPSTPRPWRCGWGKEIDSGGAGGRGGGGDGGGKE